MQRPVPRLCHAQMLFISAIVLLTAQSARANLINNGSFELDTRPRRRPSIRFRRPSSQPASAAYHCARRCRRDPGATFRAARDATGDRSAGFFHKCELLHTGR